MALSIITITNTVFADNNGSGIFAINHVTVVFTEGHSIVANNSSPTDGGGIFLAGNSYLTISDGGNASFINNTARRYGGAIYSTDNDYTSLRYATVDYKYYPDQCTVYNLSATFVNNSAAKAGDQLYGGVFTLCMGHCDKLEYLQYLLQCKNVPDTLRHATSIHPLSPVSSDPIAVCPCVDGTVNCNITSLNRVVYPGQILNVSLVTVGLCGGVSPGTVVVEHDDHINLISATTTDYTSTTCTTLNYTIKPITYVSSNTITFNVPDGNIYSIRPINVNLNILPCPLGLVVNFTLGDCVCNNDINHISGVDCNTSWMPYPIQRSGNNWIYHRYDYYNCTIAHIGCPFDYCNTSPVKLNLNESDLQCNFNRSGILCGKCKQGLSLMIGSNRCANCTDTTLVAVSIAIIAAVAGVVLVVVIKIFNVTISDGSINGLLFYAYIVKLNESIYFPKGSIPVISQFIAWINLDLGIQYCFINGLDGYWKMWLQFVFPLYLWFLVMVIIAACRYSGKASQLWSRGDNSVSVLATLILMPYTKVLRNITNSFSIITLACGENKWQVWSIDGNIDYVSSKHVILFAVSILFLLAGMAYTGLVLTYQWLLRCSGKCCKGTRDPIVKLKPILDVYTGLYKDKYRFWTGLRLIIHLCLTVLFAFTSGMYSYVNNYIICATVFFLTSITISQRDIRLRYREMLSYVNLFLLSLLSAVFSSNQSAVCMTTIVSVSVEMMLFAIAATVNFYTVCKKMWPSTCTCLNKYNFRVPLHSPHIQYQPLVPVGANRAQSPDTVVNKREPMIFENNLDQVL